MNEPGLKFGVPSTEFTMPVAPALIVGRVSVPVGVSETTLSPESVIMYAVVPAEFTAIMRGLLAGVDGRTESAAGEAPRNDHRAIQPPARYGSSTAITASRTFCAS